MADWGYGAQDGPHTWSHRYPHAAGKKQSPINIDSHHTEWNPSLIHTPLVISYQPEVDLEIGNSGFTFKAVTKKESYICGGPLSNKYRLAQFHLHWGSGNRKGSEHTVDGDTYAAELHMVHWNTEKFSCFEDASKADNGLAVLGVFIKAGNEHEGFKALSDCMDNVKFKDQHHNIHNYDPSVLLPENTSRYWTYSGSLTTPPCSESVVWILFEQAVDLSEAQMNMLRSLVCEKCESSTSHNIKDNYRPVMPLNGRVISASFRKKHV